MNIAQQQMSAPLDTTEVPLIWVALGTLATACSGGFMLLWSAITGVRNEGNTGRKNIWNRLTSLNDKDADRRVDDAKHSVTREDIAEFRDEFDELIERRFKLFELRVADMVRYEIENRKPQHGV